MKWRLKMSTLSKQVGGDHYRQGTIQPIEYIMANKLDFNEGSIVKYITRHRRKGGREDILKIKQYCDFILGEYSSTEEANLNEKETIKVTQTQEVFPAPTYWGGHVLSKEQTVQGQEEGSIQRDVLQEFYEGDTE